MSERIPIRPQAAKKQKRGVVSLRDRSNNRIDRATNGISPKHSKNRFPSTNCCWAISFIDTIGAISPTVIWTENLTMEGVTMPTIRMKHRHDHRKASNFMWIESIMCSYPQLLINKSRHPAYGKLDAPLITGGLDQAGRCC
jgi:hypothetical protein